MPQHAVLPYSLPVDTRTTSDVGPDYILRACDAPEFVGTNLLDLPGVRDTFFDDYEEVMHGRRPLTVRRFWNGTVWHVEIAPSYDGGISIDALAILKLECCDGLTVTHLHAFVSRVLQALAGDDHAPSRPQVPPASLAADGSSRLRAVPSEA